MNQHLLQQFNATYNTNEWFVSFKSAIQNLTEDEAKHKIAPDVHSVYELVVHLVFWNERYLQKWHNETLTELANNDVTFENPDDMSWQSLLLKADKVFNTWQIEISNAVEARLNQGNWLSVIGNIAAHNAYHIGQIVLLRKLQQTWDSKQGVS